MDFPYGLDVASYQGDTSDDDPRLQNRGFVIVKSTEGTSYINPYRDSWIDVCRRTGRKIGSYHFMKAGAAESQARYFLDNTPRDLDFYALDMEDGGDGYDWYGRTRFAIDFCGQVARETGRPCIIYVNRSWANSLWSAAGDLRDQLARIPLWIADYTGQPGIYSGPVPDGWHIAIHQYTSTPLDTNLMVDDNFLTNIQDQGEIDDMHLSDIVRWPAELGDHAAPLETVISYIDHRCARIEELSDRIAAVVDGGAIDRPYTDRDGKQLDNTDLKNVGRWDAQHYFDLDGKLDKILDRLDALEKKS